MNGEMRLWLVRLVKKFACVAALACAVIVVRVIWQGWAQVVERFGDALYLSVFAALLIEFITENSYLPLYIPLFLSFGKKRISCFVEGIADMLIMSFISAVLLAFISYFSANYSGVIDLLGMFTLLVFYASLAGIRGVAFILNKTAAAIMNGVYFGFATTPLAYIFRKKSLDDFFGLISDLTRNMPLWLIACGCLVVAVNIILRYKVFMKMDVSRGLI